MIIVAVSFEQDTYSVNENSGPVQPVLRLDQPFSTPVVVTVEAQDVTATGMYVIYWKVFDILVHSSE